MGSCLSKSIPDCHELPLPIPPLEVPVHELTSQEQLVLANLHAIEEALNAAKNITDDHDAQLKSLPAIIGGLTKQVEESHSELEQNEMRFRMATAQIKKIAYLSRRQKGFGKRIRELRTANRYILINGGLVMRRQKRIEDGLDTLNTENEERLTRLEEKFADTEARVRGIDRAQNDALAEVEEKFNELTKLVNAKGKINASRGRKMARKGSGSSESSPEIKGISLINVKKKVG